MTRTVALFFGGMVVTQFLACGSNDSTVSPSGSGGSAGNGTSQSTSLGGSAVGGSSTASGGTGAASSSSIGGSSGNTTSAGGGNSDPVLTPTSPLAGKLAINEVCPSNHSGATEGGSFPDWVELHNLSSQDISLNGFYITDDSADLKKFALSKTTLVVKAGGWLILWADGDEEETDFHLGFSLAAAGETLTLLDTEGKAIDSMSWTNAESDKVYARLPDGTGAFAWCSSGTPNRANGSTCQ